MPKYLGQVVGIEADVRKSAMRRLTDAYHALDKPALLEGQLGEYTPAAEEGLQLEPEYQRVQATVEEMIEATKETLAKLFDVTAARDFTNSSGTAHADVVIGDLVLVEKAPMPYLLWLTRKLDELEAFATRMPRLSAGTEWELEEARGVWKSKPVVTIRQIQEQKALTLTPTTDKHPGQATVIQETVAAGRWSRVKFSGAVPVSRREEILRRIAALKAAVQAARDEAKRVEAVEPVVGARILSYIFDTD
jgi:hypothetical protein